MFDKIEIPILYKYRGATPIDQIHRLIREGELWFSRATSFNDPFDTALTYNFDGLDSDIAEKWVLQAVDRHKPQLTGSRRQEFASRRLAEIRTNRSDLEKTRNEFIEHNYNNFGICSFSASNDNILMWGHYAHHHQGLCIGLDVPRIWELAQQLVRQDQVLDLVKVSYSASKPQFNFFEAMLADDSEEVRDFYSTKSSLWAYENEFRLVLYNRTNIAHQFGPQLVKQIIFGFETPESEREAISRFCREHNPAITLFHATPDERQYKVNINALP